MANRNMAGSPGLNYLRRGVTVDPPLDLGDVANGRRRIVPITGGEFSGPKIRGACLPGGADWQIIRATAWRS